MAASGSGATLAGIIGRVQLDSGQFREALDPRMAQTGLAQEGTGSPPPDPTAGAPSKPADPATGHAPLALPMSDQRHADYPMYRAAVTGLEEEVKSRHIHFADHDQLERAAGQLVVEAKAAGLPAIVRVAAIDGGKAIFAMDRDPGDVNAAAARRIYVDREQAASHSVAESTRRAGRLDTDLTQALATPRSETAIAAR